MPQFLENLSHEMTGLRLRDSPSKTLGDEGKEKQIDF